MKNNKAIPLLGEIYRTPNIPTHGKTTTRQAVRAIICRVDKLLMIYSPVNGDYKFPGGGVKNGESHAQALRREICEECGISGAQVGEPYGRVIEYDRPVETDYDVFKMTSHYYFCRTDAATAPQRLDDYERQLGFTPRWVTIAEAIRANQAVLHASDRPVPRWTRRDTFVLEGLPFYSS